MELKHSILPAVAAVIFNERREILLQKRRDVGQWGIISGHVEFGETVTEAILREIREETTATAAIVRFIGVYSSPASQTYTYDDRTIQYVTSYFEAKLLQEIPLPFSNEETMELRYFSLHELPSDLAQLNPYWLVDALEEKEGPFVR